MQSSKRIQEIIETHFSKSGEKFRNVQAAFNSVAIKSNALSHAQTKIYFPMVLANFYGFHVTDAIHLDDLPKAPSVEYTQEEQPVPHPIIKWKGRFG